jgi:hypothetical protein
MAPSLPSYQTIPMRDTPFIVDEPAPADPVYSRRDHGKARVIYRSQTIQRLLGAAAARAFLGAMRVDAGLAARVLSAPGQAVRR